MRKHRLIAVFMACALLAGAVFVAGCGGDDDSDSGSSSTAGKSADLGLNSSGTLSIGSDIPYPPFEFGQPPKYQGFDIELINDIAKKLGVTTSIKATSFDTIFTDLAQGRFDAVISASTITPDRQKTVSFSDPYYEASQALVTTPDSDIKSENDLSGKTVAVQNGTTGQTYAKEKTDAGTVNGFPLGPDVINAVKGGQADAGILDQPVAADALDKGDTGFKIAQVIPTDELYGIAVSKDNKPLLNAINDALADVKKDGTLDKLYQKYFHINAPKSVIDGKTTGN